MRNRQRRMTWNGPVTKKGRNGLKWTKHGPTMFGVDRMDLNSNSLKALDEREVAIVDLPMVQMYEG